MRVINLNNSNFNETVDIASIILKSGGLIIYPTDTCYGIGVDATNEIAIDNVYKLKSRKFTNPINIIVPSIKVAKTYIELSELANQLANKYLPGALTLVLNKTNLLPKNLTSAKPTVGIRIPNNEFCLATANKFKKPYTTTSANISGHNPAYSLNEILTQFGHNKLIDLIIDNGVLPKNPPSTVVDVSNNTKIIIRQGSVII